MWGQGGVTADCNLGCQGGWGRAGGGGGGVEQAELCGATSCSSLLASPSLMRREKGEEGERESGEEGEDKRNSICARPLEESSP